MPREEMRGDAASKSRAETHVRLGGNATARARQRSSPVAAVPHMAGSGESVGPGRSHPEHAQTDKIERRIPITILTITQRNGTMIINDDKRRNPQEYIMYRTKWDEESPYQDNNTEEGNTMINTHTQNAQKKKRDDDRHKNQKERTEGNAMIINTQKNTKNTRTHRKEKIEKG